MKSKHKQFRNVPKMVKLYLSTNQTLKVLYWKEKRKWVKIIANTVKVIKIKNQSGEFMYLKVKCNYLDKSLYLTVNL